MTAPGAVPDAVPDTDTGAGAGAVPDPVPGAPAATVTGGVAGTAPRYRVGPGLLLHLLAGRGTFRLVQYVATVALLPVWGTQRYGAYAAAMAIFGWAVSITSTGPEKAALKLLPRAPRTGPPIRAFLLAVAVALQVPVAALTVLALVAGWSEVVTVYVVVAASQVAAGCNLMLVGLARADGRPRWDAHNYQGLALVTAALLGAAIVLDLGPVGFTVATVVATLAFNVALVRGLGRPSLAIRERPALLRRLLWTVGLMGSSELLSVLGIAVLFALLAASPHADQAGLLFIVFTMTAALVNVFVYVLRVYAPRTSLRQVGRGAALGRARAVRLARWAAGLAAAWLVVVGALLVGTDLGHPADDRALTVVTAVLFASHAPTLVLAMVAAYLLENSDAPAVRTTAAAAAVAFTLVVLAGLVVVPAIGGVGVVYAAAFFDLGLAGSIAAVGGRRRVRP